MGIACDSEARAPGTSDAEAVAPDVAIDSAVADSVANDTGVMPDANGGPRPKLSYAIEPITVQPGEERQMCRTINIPTDAPFDIVRFDSTMIGLSHHFNLYKVSDGSAFNPVTPDEAAVHDCAPAAEQLRGDAAYIFGSASDWVMETPPGVAFHLLPGQRLILEYHAINYTLDPIEASLEVNLTGPAPDAVIEHHADIIWFASWGFFLPPGKETSDTAKCAIPYDVEIFGLMGHFHELGTNFVVEALHDGTPTEVYQDDDWQHPLYQAFAPTLSLAAGDPIRWTCTWNNTRDGLVMPDKGSQDEMCKFFAAAYPKNTLSADPIQCNVFF